MERKINVLNTVKVPSRFEPLFRKAQEYVGRYFKEKKEDPTKGTIEIFGERYILIRAASMSVDFFDTVRSLYKDQGEEEALNVARQLLFDIAHSIGKQDARNFHKKMNLKDPIEKLSAGPIHFSYTGWAFVDIFPESKPTPDENYYLIYDHPFSFESDAWEREGIRTDFPVCIMNAGYSSGWCEESFGIALVASEIMCKAKGDEACRFIMAHPSKIEGYIREYLKKEPELAKKIKKYEIPGFNEELRELTARNVELEKTRAAMLNLLEDARELEVELRVSEQKFRDLTETTPDLIWEIDRDGVFTYVSPRAKDLLGYEVSEISNRTLFDIVSAEDAERIRRIFEEEVIKKEPLYGLEIQVRHKDGHFVVVEINAIPLFDKEEQIKGYRGVARDITHRKKADGEGEQLKGFRGIAHDITERKKMEEALLEERNKLQKYFDIAGVIIVVLSPEGKVLLVNKKGYEVLGYSVTEVIGQDWFANFVPSKKRVEMRTVFENLKAADMKNGAFGVYESPILTKDGKEQIIAWHNTVLKDKTGGVQAVLATGEDITELEQAKGLIEHLKEVDKLKDDFLNIAAHELKTPLTSILALSEMMKEGKLSSSSPEYQKYVTIIYDEGTRLTSTVRGLLTVTRYESGREITRIESFNLAAFISSLLPSLNIMAAKRRAKVVIDIKNMDIVMKSDKEKISNVVYNFVDNAVKYGRDGQTITISVAEPKKEWVSVEVTDQGEGIPEELQKRLFAKFSQLEPSISRSQEGIGLGLYICKLTIDQLGGGIGARSTPGKGSTFYFSLPLEGHPSLSETP
jgi:PAS domain S-box-containing protein